LASAGVIGCTEGVGDALTDGDAEGFAVLAQPDSAKVAMARVAATAIAFEANELIMMSSPVR
jgi:hypothetical protein